jgi:hypothetical protein
MSRRSDISVQKIAQYPTPYFVSHETYLKQTYIYKTEATGNDDRPNVLATWTKSKLSTCNKILMYKKKLKRICTYEIQLWGTVSNSNIEILERFQSEVLPKIIDSPWYMPNSVRLRDFQASIVKEEIRHYISQNSARLSVQSSNLLVNLIAQPGNRRLRRHLPNNLPTRFEVITLFVV